MKKCDPNLSSCQDVLQISHHNYNYDYNSNIVDIICSIWKLLTSNSIHIRLFVPFVLLYYLAKYLS